jgi:hypothetical protein
MRDKQEKELGRQALKKKVKRKTQADRKEKKRLRKQGAAVEESEDVEEVDQGGEDE